MNTLKAYNARTLMHLAVVLAAVGFGLLCVSCMSSKGSRAGGEVTGIGGAAYAEPTPYGMVLVDRGAYKMGPAKDDSAWNIKANPRGVSIESFWMDETEVTNSKYKQFVFCGHTFRR